MKNTELVMYDITDQEKFDTAFHVMKREFLEVLHGREAHFGSPMGSVTYTARIEELGNKISKFFDEKGLKVQDFKISGVCQFHPIEVSPNIGRLWRGEPLASEIISKEEKKKYNIPADPIRPSADNTFEKYARSVAKAQGDKCYELYVDFSDAVQKKVWKSKKPDYPYTFWFGWYWCEGVFFGIFVYEDLTCLIA